MPVFCGIDWAEDHDDIAIVDDGGLVLARRRIADDSFGYQLLLGLLAEHGDTQEEPILVAIETPRGLLVACLRRTGRQIYAINPLAVARYRERHSLARAKSDRVDAELLANILRTDRLAHRPLPADSELAQAIAVLARAQQAAVWNRQHVANQLRSLLREYDPAFLEAFQDRRPGGLAHPDARAMLAIAPTPAHAARLTRPQLTAALKRAGRQRGITAASIRLQAIVRQTWLHQPALVEQAMGRQAVALLTTGAGWPAIDTPPLNAICSTASSAVSITAYRPARPMPRKPRSRTPMRLPLDIYLPGMSRHTPDPGCRRDALAAEHFDRVTFAHYAGRPRFWTVQHGMVQRFGQPDWHRVERAQVETWIGEALPEPPCTCPGEVCSA